MSNRTKGEMPRTTLSSLRELISSPSKGELGISFVSQIVLRGGNGLINWIFIWKRGGGMTA